VVLHASTLDIMRFADAVPIVLQACEARRDNGMPASGTGPLIMIEIDFATSGGVG